MIPVSAQAKFRLWRTFENESLTRKSRSEKASENPLSEPPPPLSNRGFSRCSDTEPSGSPPSQKGATTQFESYGQLVPYIHCALRQSR